jgi:hypothetical protein
VSDSYGGRDVNLPAGVEVTTYFSPSFFPPALHALYVVINFSISLICTAWAIQYLSGNSGKPWQNPKNPRLNFPARRIGCDVSHHAKIHCIEMLGAPPLCSVGG